MPKPVCLNCARFYRPHRNGIAITEMMPKGIDRQPGLADPTGWKPYKVWQADLWQCQGCGHLLVTGFGNSPISEHYMPDFAKENERSIGVINDC